MSPDRHLEPVADKELPTPIQNIYSTWGEIALQPHQWLEDISDVEIAFAAGGGLPLRFGIKDSEIWRSLQTAFSESETNTLTIAGINFTQPDLQSLGHFYRFLRAHGRTLHCIDERLQQDLAHPNSQVHELCGACAAVHSVIDPHLDHKHHTEDILIRELGETRNGKQPIHPEMPDHTSLVISVNYKGDDAVIDPDKREHLRINNALPFQVSLPVSMIEQYCRENNLNLSDQARLVKVLVDWNVQIARNIIGGHHNTLSRHANHTLIVIDTRDTEHHSIQNQITRRIANVPHGRLIIIG